MTDKEKVIEGLIFFILGMITGIIGGFLWWKNPNSISGPACFYFAGQFIGIGRETIK